MLWKFGGVNRFHKRVKNLAKQVIASIDMGKTFEGVDLTAGRDALELVVGQQ